MMLTGVAVIPALLGLLCLQCVEAQDETVCQSEAFRQLAAQQQNVHQCLLLENMQADMDSRHITQTDQFDNLFRMMTRLHDNMVRGFRMAARSSRRDQARSTPGLGDIPMARDCQELYQSGITVSGVYPIRLPSRTFVNVQCDMDTMNGGWTVIQRRMDGSVNFTRRWAEYAFGFGNVNTEYWLGNEHLNRMTTILKYSLLVGLWDWDDNYAYALYDNFHVGNEYTMYQLRVQNYSGTAGDSLGLYHEGMRFSTFDSDNDNWHSSCAIIDQSGWWFNDCGKASLNGPYKDKGTATASIDGMFKGIIWYDWKNSSRYSMKKIEMKIKPFTSVLYERVKEEQAKIITSTTTTPKTTTTTTTETIPTTTSQKQTITTTIKTATTTLPNTPLTRVTTKFLPKSRITQKTISSSTAIAKASTSPMLEMSTSTPVTTTPLPLTSYSPNFEGQNGEAYEEFMRELKALRAARKKLDEEIERFKILEKERNEKDMIAP